MSNHAILFVDDEPRILEGLKRMLWSMRGEWDLGFACNASDALERLAQRKYDIVVSDMRMPVMDGATLLREVKRTHPGVVRIVLSGHADQEALVKAAEPAHQYLAKPCEARELVDTLRRAIAPAGIVTPEPVRNLVASIASLPSAPSLYSDLMTELQSPEPSIGRVGQLVSKDVAMSAKVLQLANSAFFGLPQLINEPVRAVTYLGLETFSALAYSTGVFAGPTDDELAECDIDRLCVRSVVTGHIAKAIAQAQDADQLLVSAAHPAGLLHDIGVLTLATKRPQEYAESSVLAEAKGISRSFALREVFGSTPATVGGYLLGLWGLPDAIVEAVAFHESPGRCGTREFSLVTAVHAARQVEAELFDLGAERAGFVDWEYLDDIGMSGRFEAWRECAGEAWAAEEVK